MSNTTTTQAEKLPPCPSGCNLRGLERVQHTASVTITCHLCGLRAPESTWRRLAAASAGVEQPDRYILGSALRELAPLCSECGKPMVYDKGSHGTQHEAEQQECWYCSNCGVSTEVKYISQNAALAAPSTPAEVEVNQMLLAFVRDFAQNGCHHHCTKGNCSHAGNLRMAKAEELILLTATSAEEKCADHCSHIPELIKDGVCQAVRHICGEDYCETGICGHRCSRPARS